MTYDELRFTEEQAWQAFFAITEQAGIDTGTLGRSLNGKDCFNDVFDCLIAVAEISDE